MTCFLPAKILTSSTVGDHGADDIVDGEPDYDRSDGDTVSYEKSEEAVMVDLSLEGTQNPADTDDDGVANRGLDENPVGSYARGDTLINIENVIGSDNDDVLMGNNQVNELYGGDGDDTMTAVANAEVDGVVAGPDVLVGGAGDDELTGSANTDVLMGGDGHDTITGNGGADRIDGGAGDDVMTGGDGTADDNAADTFVFSPADGDGDDVITDVDEDGTDKIDLSAFELSPREQTALAESITMRGDDVRIDLSDFGGGTILLQGLVDLDDLGTLNTDGDGLVSLGIFDVGTNETGVFIV